MEYRKRKMLRLPHYDYSQNGFYFITICTHNRENIFWDGDSSLYSNGEHYELSEYGQIAQRFLHEIPRRYPGIFLDKYIIMPNHIHLILIISKDNEKFDGRLVIAPTSISKIMQQYKSAVTKEIGIQIWQKSFHEHIIRSSGDYEEIWKYIESNPQNWNAEM